MVGTFYTSSAPDAPPFVTTGSVVHPDTIVGIIEAMKVFTEIPAGVSGTIVEILAKNGQPVEFGQALFRVLPSWICYWFRSYAVGILGASWGGRDNWLSRSRSDQSRRQPVRTDLLRLRRPDNQSSGPPECYFSSCPNCVTPMVIGYSLLVALNEA